MNFTELTQTDIARDVAPMFVAMMDRQIGRVNCYFASEGRRMTARQQMCDIDPKRQSRGVTTFLSALRACEGLQDDNEAWSARRKLVLEWALVSSDTGPLGELRQSEYYERALDMMDPAFRDLLSPRSYTIPADECALRTFEAAVKQLREKIVTLDPRVVIGELDVCDMDFDLTADDLLLLDHTAGVTL